jgi:predicted SnoaL-like aldol condensation-catalyzing enzyme
MTGQQEVLERATRQENVNVVRRLIDEGFNEGNRSAGDETVSVNMKEYQRFDPPLPPGPAGTKALIGSLRGMFPDLKLTIEDIAVEGDKVWIRMRARGTNEGSIMGKPPTGKKMEIDVIDICRVKEGKIVEHWGVPDLLGMLEQVGIIE